MTRLNFGVHPREYPGTLADRHRALVAEMLHRGFSPAFREPRGDGVRATEVQLAEARLLVTERIRDRLASMTRVPRWTMRSPPDWV